MAKEKHFKVLGAMIEAIEKVLDDSAFENLDLATFYLNFLDAMMSNAKGNT